MLDLRCAAWRDVPALEALIRHSGLELSAGYYTPEQAEAIVRHVFGVDSQLIEDGSYYLIEDEARIVACGGWSRRHTLFGADRTKAGPDPLLDPATDPARIRAFFVHPDRARQGLGRRLLDACSAAAKAAGFQSLQLAATLPGEPLYRSCGFVALERFDLALPGAVRVPLVRMQRPI